MNSQAWRLADQHKGRLWARDLSSSQRGDFIDACVLGCFDWRDWFDDKPSGPFLRGAFHEAQYREEIDG